MVKNGQKWMDGSIYESSAAMLMEIFIDMSTERSIWYHLASSLTWLEIHLVRNSAKMSSSINVFILLIFQICMYVFSKAESSGMTMLLYECHCNKTSN